jgi:hypothetical protein
MSDRTISTIVLVVFTPIFTMVVMPFFLWVAKCVTKLIPEGRFKEVMTYDASAKAKPTLESLRRGLR